MTATKKLPRTRNGNIIGNTNAITEYWVERLQTRSPGYDSQGRSSMSYSGDNLMHYGHWTLATAIRRPNGTTRLVLINGDRYGGAGGFGPTTQSRTNDAERAVKAAGLDYLTVPFSALSAAEIDRASIQVLEMLPERITTTYRTVARAQLSQWQSECFNTNGYVHVYRYTTRDPEEVYPNDDGSFSIPADRHWLGEAVFKATVMTNERRDCTPEEIAAGDYKGWRYRGPDQIPIRYITHRRKAKFLSAFDHNEARECYFLCELPRTSATTVDEAFDALMPTIVKSATDSGLDVLRQGDIFAIPTSMTTRELKSRAKAAARMEPLLKTNHVATEQVETTDGDTYARGRLRHRPDFRTPDHAQIKLGDGRTWYRIVKNTVPLATKPGRRSAMLGPQQSGISRAWTLGGAVD